MFAEADTTSVAHFYGIYTRSWIESQAFNISLSYACFLLSSDFFPKASEGDNIFYI